MKWIENPKTLDTARSELELTPPPSLDSGAKSPIQDSEAVPLTHMPSLKAMKRGIPLIPTDPEFLRFIPKAKRAYAVKGVRQT